MFSCLYLFFITFTHSQTSKLTIMYNTIKFIRYFLNFFIVSIFITDNIIYYLPLFVKSIKTLTFSYYLFFDKIKKYVYMSMCQNSPSLLVPVGICQCAKIPRPCWHICQCAKIPRPCWHLLAFFL